MDENEIENWKEEIIAFLKANRGKEFTEKEIYEGILKAKEKS